jgi:hypothetical protein
MVPNKIDQYSRKTNSVAVLPRGWEVAYNSNNIQYFIDHNTKQTYWELPDEILHPAPLPEVDSDEETTVSSVISYLSHKSLGTGFPSMSFRQRRDNEGTGESKGPLHSIGKSVRQIFGLKKTSKESPSHSPRDEEMDLGGEKQQQLSSNALLFQQQDDDNDDDAKVEKENGSNEKQKSDESTPERPKSIYLRRLPNSNESVNLSLRSIPTHDDTDFSVASSPPAALATPTSSDVTKSKKNSVLELAELSPRFQRRPQLRGQVTTPTPVAAEDESTTRNGCSATKDVLFFVFGENQSCCSAEQLNAPSSSHEDVTVSHLVTTAADLPSPSSGDTKKMTSKTPSLFPFPTTETVSGLRNPSTDDRHISPPLSVRSSRQESTTNSNRSSRRTSSDYSGNPLPLGWEQCQTASGRLFYINHNDRTTHWSLPTQPQP